jgi:triphosphoribosyl-dephospho-CoA synthetase
LDTEGKSKQLFLEILDVCIDETRNFFSQLKQYILKDNQLELDQELETIFSILFSDFQKLYH